MKKKYLILFYMAILTIVHATVQAQSPVPGARTTPVCLGEIQESAASSDYELRARKMAEAHKLTSDEVLARLIFSEALATGCIRDADCNNLAGFRINIMIKIGWGIARQFKDIVKGAKPSGQLDNKIYTVVFKKDQFQTSFVPKMKNGQKNIFAQTFLCPEKIKDYLDRVKINYLDLFETAEQVAKEVKENDILGDYRFVTNFYYPLSPVFGEIIPDWAKDAKPLIGNKWIQMYHIKH